MVEVTASCKIESRYGVKAWRAGVHRESESEDGVTILLSRFELLAGGESEAGLKGVRAVWSMTGSWSVSKARSMARSYFMCPRTVLWKQVPTLRYLPCSPCCNHRANQRIRLQLQYKSDSRWEVCTARGPQASKNRVIGTFLRVTCFHGVVCSKVHGKSEVYVIAARQHSSTLTIQAK